MDKGRKNDLEELRKDYQRTQNPDLRRAIEEAGRRISKETGIIKSMREALINEHRHGRIDNVKDIHEYIKNKEKYQNK